MFDMVYIVCIHNRSAGTSQIMEVFDNAKQANEAWCALEFNPHKHSDVYYSFSQWPVKRGVDK